MNVTILDNKNLEHKLTLGRRYEVKGETTGDFYDYYLLLCDDGKQHWVEKYRVCKSELLFQTPLPKKSLEEAYDEPISTFNSEHLRETLKRWAVPNWQGGYVPPIVPNNTVDLKTILDLPHVKPIVQRIICIPDENGHIVDLQRVQYISPLDDKKEGKPYSVTLVSGWEMKLTDDVYSREKLIGLWRMLQNK